MLKYFIIIGLACFGVGCNSNDNVEYCPDIEPNQLSTKSLWQQFNVTVPISPISENLIGIACHNCYANQSIDILDSHLRIELAIQSQVNAIELDVVFPDENYSQPMVSHDLTSSYVPLIDVLNNALLQQSRTMIFIELKGKIVKEQYIRDVLDVLKHYETSSPQYDYLNPNRFVAIRSFEHDTTLVTARKVITEVEYLGVQPFIKLSRLHYVKKLKTLKAEVEQAYECGMSMVEFDYRIGSNDIKALNSYAETMGMAVNVFTLDESNYREAIQELKDEVDVITVTDTLNSENNSLFERLRLLISE